MFFRYVTLCFCLLSCLHFNIDGNLQSEDSFPSETNPVGDFVAPQTFKLIAEGRSVEQGKPFWIALEASLEKGWHSYWKNPGDSGMPLQIEWTLSEGFTITDFQWPCPQKFEHEGLVGYGYTDKTTFLVEITPSKKLPLVAAGEVHIGAEIRWLACSDATCMPGDDSLSMTLPLRYGVEEKSVEKADSASFFQAARAALPRAVTVAEVKKEHGLIELRLPLAGQSLVKRVQFFPEHKKTIDAAAEVTFSMQGEDSIRVLLKEHKNAQSQQLKGVVLLLSDTPPFKQAIEIDVPLASDREMALALASPVKAPLALESDPMADAEFSGGLGMALLFALLGGAILNLMPCVLPVISFKILSFVKMAGQSRMKTFQHGLAFSVGVLVSFWVLAIIMLSLQSYGQLVGWGFQLQEPLFIALLAALLFVVALNLFGVFEVGLSVTGVAGNLEQGSSAKFSGLMGSFCSGILATALATPCTGPFLGSAVGFAVTLPAPQALLIFTCLGLGMSSPYLILSGFPSLLRFMPKPGSWMVTFKELMGFVMLATVLWLLWVFSSETGTFATLLVLVAFFILSFAAWIYGRYCTPISSKFCRIVALLAVVLCTGAAGYTLVGASSPLIAGMDRNGPGEASNSSEVAWNAFTPQKLEAFQATKRPIFIDFTAKWCLICQANHLVLSTKEVQAKFAEKNVILVKADWTRNDPEITKFLRRYGRNGVPLYLLFGDAAESPQILPQVLTPESVIQALNQL